MKKHFYFNLSFLLKRGGYQFCDYMKFGRLTASLRLVGFSLQDVEEIAPFLSESKVGHCAQFYNARFDTILIGTLFFMMGLSKTQISGLMFN